MRFSSPRKGVKIAKPEGKKKGRSKTPVAPGTKFDAPYYAAHPRLLKRAQLEENLRRLEKKLYVSSQRVVASGRAERTSCPLVLLVLRTSRGRRQHSNAAKDLAETALARPTSRRPVSSGRSASSPRRRRDSPEKYPRRRRGVGATRLL